VDQPFFTRERSIRSIRRDAPPRDASQCGDRCHHSRSIARTLSRCQRRHFPFVSTCCYPLRRMQSISIPGHECVALVMVLVAVIKPLISVLV